MGMPDVTTIKVSKELRDRLATRARREHLTLGAVIARALDESDERAFWSAVTAEHAALTEDDRRAQLADATLADVVDPEDDAVSAQDAW